MPPATELVYDVAVTVPATEICDPLSVTIESVTCSSPAPFNNLFCVNKVSLPILLNVGGPITKIEEVTPPSVLACTNIHWSFCESKYIEPLRCGDEPESITSRPPKRTDGLSTLTVILFVPTFKVLCET